MTVKELIKILEELDENMIITKEIGEGNLVKVEEVDEYKNIVVLI